nr:MAG TPA: hypothetical protein [Caudoviricetes sp.]
MADETKPGAAQNKLGELFVDFTTKGLPSMLKNLNSVSASFLLGKNAANQFVQTLNKPIKEAGQGAVEIGKMSAALGLTKREAMQLQLYFKQHNLSEGLISDLTSVSDMLTKVKMGIGGISGEFAFAMHKMGLSWADYDGSMESMIRLTNDVKKATQGMSAQQARVLRQQVGLGNQDWAYAFERGDFNLGDYKTISDKEVDDLIRSQEAISNAAAEFEQLKMHLISKLTPAVETIAGWVGDKSGKGAQGKYDQSVADAAKSTAKTVGHGLMSTPLGGIITAGTVLTSTGKSIINTYDQAQNNKNTNTKGIPTGGAAPIAPDFMMTPQDLAPTNTSNLMQTNNIQITNQNTINGTNANDVKDRIISINENDINYSQYQVSNMAGL